MTQTLPPPTRRALRFASEEPVRRFRRDIEALRAVAVLVVVLYHAGVPVLPGGFVGVDVFFVVSGFLITTHLYGELSRTGRVRLGRFYARRARRLLPAAALVSVVTVAAAWALRSGLAAADAGADAVWSAVFAMNVHLALTGVDYQANQDPSLLQHYWSLSVEEQFYLVWPLLMIGAGLAGAAVLGRRFRRTVVGVVVALVMVASFAYGQHLMATTPTMAYFLSPARAWELGLGALVAIAAPWLARRRSLRSGLWAALGLLLILAAAIGYDDGTPFPGVAALLPTVGAAMVIVAGLTRESRLERRVLGRGALQGLGRLSYGWYLWHWPMLLLVPDLLDRSTSVLENLVACGVALVFAMWTYVALENPVRSLPALAARTWRSLAAGAGTVLAVVAVSGVAMVWGPNAYVAGDFVEEVAPSAITEAVVASSALEIVPGNLDPGLETMSRDKPDLDAGDGISCMVGLLTSDISEEPGGSCVAGGTEGGSTTVVLVGDSHAYHWVPALREIAIERDWRLVSLTKSGCTFNDVALVNTQLDRDYTECAEWREAAWERIEAEQPELILTAAAIFSPREGDFSQRWAAGVATTTAALVATGAQVITIADTPYPRVDVPSCLAENVRSVSECVLPPEEAYSDPDRRADTLQEALAAGSEVIDPRPWFCSTTACPVVVGNLAVYSDNSHMTATYSRSLATVLGAELDATIGAGA